MFTVIEPDGYQVFLVVDRVPLPLRMVDLGQLTQAAQQSQVEDVSRQGAQTAV